MTTVSRVLIESYQQAPDTIALYLLKSGRADLAITYGDLVRRSLRYTRSLEREGIRPDEVVILILQHGEDLIASFFGSILAGAIPAIMPFLTEKLSPEVYRRSLKALFEVTQPAAVITYADFAAEARQVADAVPSVRSLLITEGVPPPGEPTLTTDLDRLPGLRAHPEEVVLLQHSSGTTGLQKGVALSHRAVFNQLDSYSRAIRLAPGDVIVSWLPLYHDMGLIAGFVLPIMRRVPLVLMSPFDWVRAPHRLMQAISRYRGTLCWLPNFAYNFCAQKIRPRDLEGVDLSSWRAVINCSEPMHWKSHQMFLECFAAYGLRPEALATCYAMAENVFAVTQGGIDQPVRLDPISHESLTSRMIAEPSRELQALPMLSAGRPIQNTRVRVIDARGAGLPERHVGEIAIQSDCLLNGYFQRPDLTEKAFQDGWYLTGDLGYLAEGELYITGRKKDLIIVGGKNIYPQDLERLAEEATGVHPGRVVAFGVFDERIGTEEVVLVAEVEDDRLLVGIRAEQVASEIRERVTRGSEIALRRVQLVKRNWLLKTSSGKIARGANRDKYLREYPVDYRPGE